MLRGASAEAREELGAVVRKDRTQAASATLGEELFGVVGVLRSEPALRRVATDSSVDPEAKAGLVRDVFGGQVSDDTLGVLVEAVQRRWTASWDLADVLEELAVVALVRSVGRNASRISDELFSVVRLLEENPDLRSALSDVSRTPEDRAALLTGILGEHTLPATSRIVAQAVASNRAGVEKVLADYQRVAATAQDETLAVVRTARELGDRELERLSAALGKQYGTTVHLHVVVDPDLVGGVRIEIGDDRIDGSISARIDEARRRLVG